MSRVPTRKQYGKLKSLAGAWIVCAPSRRDWEPLRRNGWTRDADPPAEQSFTPGRGSIYPQQITPAGLRALADAMECYEGEGDRG